MPTYDYKCHKCNHTEELLLRLSEHVVTLPCPSCGGSMEQYFPRPPSTGSFPAFTLEHSRHLSEDGEPIEIHSLADIRRLEKKHEDRELCWEPGSFDTKHGEEF
jgi:putative FmdB family regulatory protein